MEKSKILNIADNLSLLNENYKRYKEIENKNDFESYNQKRIVYINWIVVLCDIYNSLLKFYKNDTNEYWDKIKSFVSKKYNYENIEITFKELLKKYRNKNTHPENNNSIENNLLPVIVNVEELEKLQAMLNEVIKYELEQIDFNHIVTHIIKSGSNVIVYTKIFNSINESMQKATNEEKKLLVVPYNVLKTVFNILTDETILTEEIINELDKDLEVADDFINSNEFTESLLKQPNGQDYLDFFNTLKQSSTGKEIYDCLLEFKQKTFNNVENHLS